MRWFFVCAAAALLMYFADPSPASSRLSYGAAVDAGANECLSHLFEIPGEHIDADLHLYRQAPLRFVGHCTLSNWRGDTLRADFTISKYHRADGRWQVALRAKDSQPEPLLSWR